MLTGDSVTLKIAVHGNPDPKVEWYFNGEEIKENERRKFEVRDNVYKLSIKDVINSDGGKYSVEVHNRVGRDSVKATLTVKGMWLHCSKRYLISYQSFKQSVNQSVS